VSAALDALRAVLGAEHLIADGDLSRWQIDWRRRYRGQALAVARPASTEQVAAVVRICAEHRVPVVAQGGNTGLVGGGVPDASGTQLVLDLGRLNRIRDLDAANLSMTVEAGCVLQAVQQAAEAAGLLFPLSLAAEGSCTIGGNLATNAGGTQVLRYGNARELCLGLEVVTPAGEVWHGLSGLRKDNTGYDLRDLYIGSEGTLGIITAATLKLHPRPALQWTALAACDAMPRCVELLQLARARFGAGLTGFEVMNAQSLELVAQHFPALPRPLAASPWTVLIEYSAEAVAGDDDALVASSRAHFEGLLEAAFEAGTITDAALAESLAQSRQLWHLRESIPLAQAEEGLNIKHDIALPVSAIPAFVEATDAQIAQRFPGARMVDFGHLGDGNLHYNVQAPLGVAAADFLEREEASINHLVYDAVLAHGGSISAEHGIGALKRDTLPHYKSAVALGVMKSIKRALDPLGIMNPGRLIDAG